MNLYVNWLKKNWLPIALALVVLVLLGDKACSDAAYRRDIRELDEDIGELEEKNRGLDDEVRKATRAAMAAEAVVAEKEKDLEESRLRIRDLRDRRVVVAVEIRELPPTDMVERLREVLDCAAVELTDHGVLMPVDCARGALAQLADFSLIREELEETQFSLATAEEALQFQKMATWNVYKIAWAQGSQLLNYRDIVAKKDEKFRLCERQRRRSFWRGLKTGVAVGAGITVLIVGLRAVFK